MGIGVGTIWYLITGLIQNKWQLKGEIDVADLAFWTVAAFFIGIAFNLTSFIFQIDNWSLRRQIIINFFVDYFAWLLFELAINSFYFSWQFLFEITLIFLIMYLIAYGQFLGQLYRDVKRINQKLKKQQMNK